MERDKNGAELDPRIPGFNWQTFSEYQRNTELEIDPQLPSEIYEEYKGVEQYGESPELLPEEVRKQIEFTNDVIVKAKEIFAENFATTYGEHSLVDFDVVLQVARDKVVEERGALEQ